MREPFQNGEVIFSFESILGDLCSGEAVFVADRLNPAISLFKHPSSVCRIIEIDWNQRKGTLILGYICLQNEWLDFVFLLR